MQFKYITKILVKHGFVLLFVLSVVFLSENAAFSYLDKYTNNEIKTTGWIKASGNVGLTGALLTTPADKEIILTAVSGKISATNYSGSLVSLRILSGGSLVCDIDIPLNFQDSNGYKFYVILPKPRLIGKNKNITFKLNKVSGTGSGFDVTVSAQYIEL